MAGPLPSVAFFGDIAYERVRCTQGTPVVADGPFVTTRVSAPRGALRRFHRDRAASSHGYQSEQRCAWKSVHGEGQSVLQRMQMGRGGRGWDGG